jgi:7-cyano-7-deazaguanine synthase in queuosine biosynthesis
VRRFTFAARLGIADTMPLMPMQPDSTVIQVQFISAYRRLDFGLGSALDFLRAHGRCPAETAVDLVILAGLINAADTRISRAANAQNGWSREIDLIVPVSDPTLWAAQSELLSTTLKFLTGDFWRIAFRGRPVGFDTIIDHPQRLPLDSYDEVALFSGGLDSLIGAIDLLTAGKRPMLVSHWWDAETSKAQQTLLQKLETRFPTNSARSLRVRLGFSKNDVSTGETENSQRGRSFMFFALAAVTAVSFGTPQVIVPENGLIGLNVPLDPLRLGALSTRTTHPHYMANFNSLLAGLGLPVRLENPYRHMTKGEMVKQCRDRQLLQALVPMSMSCSSPAKVRFRRLSPRHCGTCVPCLIRRASLSAGLSTIDSTLYFIPTLTAQTLNTARAEGEHVRSFQLLMSQLKANPSSAASLARIAGPLNDAPAEVDDYVDVFRRGIHEVDALLQNVRAAPS